MSSFTHRGPWDAHSQKSRALNFIEKYSTKVDSLDLSSTPSNAFYAPFAIFHDTKGDVHITGPQIWEWMKRLFSPFSEIKHEVVELRVMPDSEGRDIVYGEFLTHFRLRGEEDEIVAPRFFVFTVGEAEGGAGTDGLQIHEVRLFWDTGIIGRYVTERKKREEMNRGSVLEGIKQF